MTFAVKIGTRHKTFTNLSQKVVTPSLGGAYRSHGSRVTHV